MFIINDEDSLQSAMLSSLSDAVKELIRRRADQLRDYDGYTIADLCVWIIAEPPDSYAAVVAALPCPLIIDGAPAWECIEQYGDHIEVTFILSDSGEGAVLIVHDREGIDPKLLALLRAPSP